MSFKNWTPLPEHRATAPSRAERIGARSEDAGSDMTSIPDSVVQSLADRAPDTHDPAIHPTGNPWSGYWDADGNWID